MDPYHLRTFLAVEKHLNYTHAARELLLSQPAVSRQIHALETELAVRLFEQLGKALYLTEAGRTLAREARQLLGDHERAAEAVRAHQGLDCGSLRVGASTTPGFYLLPPVLGRFHAEHPRVEPCYRVENSLRIEEALLRNELDLGFVGSHVPGREIHRELMVEDRIVFFTSPKNPLASHRRIAPATLFREVCVLREEGSATRRLMEEALASKGIAIQRSLSLGCPEAVKAVVAGGLGFSFLSIHGLQGDFATGRLTRLSVRGLRLRRSIECIRHVEKHITPLMSAFLEAARGAMRQSAKSARLESLK